MTWRDFIEQANAICPDDRFFSASVTYNRHPEPETEYRIYDHKLDEQFVAKTPALALAVWKRDIADEVGEIEVSHDET